MGSPVPAAYGFDEDPATWRLLRARPPRPALDWAAEALGGGTVTAVRALRGGLASAVHLLTVDQRVRVVLRRYVRPEVNLEEPEIARWEARALRFVAAVELPTPTLLAVDATGTAAGVPAVLMSRLPGRVEWSPPHRDRWLLRLAEQLPPIHAAPLPLPGAGTRADGAGAEAGNGAASIRPFAPYRQDRYELPAWARWPAVWARAVDWFHRPTPPDAGPAVFVHRDYHPGNVLWRRGRVTGVVDWASASIGPAVVDVGHCRGNLFPYGLAVADHFTAHWERQSGARYHPWADIVTIIGDLDGLRDDPRPASERRLVEDALARAVAELG